MTGGERNQVKALYAALNDRLENSGASGFTRFLNFGYRPLEGDTKVGPKIAPFAPGHDSLQLLFQLVNGAIPSGGLVVDLGCGRGGNLWACKHFLGTERGIGIDIARSSLQYARSMASHRMLIEGDAMCLPLRGKSVDTVLTVESSCHYSDLEGYLREVARVVKVGGWFLYADVLPATVAEAIPLALTSLGMRVECSRDVTPNVLMSRSARNAHARSILSKHGEDSASQEWVGGPGSKAFEGLSDGSLKYFMIRAQGSAARQPSDHLFDKMVRATIVEGARRIAEALELE